MNDILKYIVAFVAAYIFGSIPWALVIGKVFYKIDVREHGSGNLGGSNAGRVLGAKAGAATIVLDALKSFIVVSILSFIDPTIAALAGMFSSLGHCFPIFAQFKGGKAVATNYGYIIAVSLFVTHNVLIQSVLPLAIFVILLLLFKMVSLASVVSLIVAAGVSFTQDNIWVTIGIVAVSGLSVYRHIPNIKRIINGDEAKVGFLGK